MTKYDHLRLVLVLAVLCMGFVFAPRAQAEPQAVILFTGNSLGKYDPCPACDEGEPVGGLARRSNIFAQYRDTVPEDKLFILGGGNEFLPILPVDEPDKRETRFTAKVYALLDYDLGLLLPEEAARLQEAGADPMPAWRSITGRPEAMIVENGGVSLGVVVFPAGGKILAEEGEAMMRSVAEAARELSVKADLVVGMSPWGEPYEKRFVEAYPDVLDVLLGSGFGAGSGLRRVDGARTLWIRPEFNGWSVMALTVNRLPDKDGQEPWGGESDASFVKVKLDEGVAEDAAVAGLLGWL